MSLFSASCKDVLFVEGVIFIMLCSVAGWYEEILFSIYCGLTVLQNGLSHVWKSDIAQYHMSWSVVTYDVKWVEV